MPFCYLVSSSSLGSITVDCILTKLVWPAAVTAAAATVDLQFVKLANKQFTTKTSKMENRKAPAQTQQRNVYTLSTDLKFRS